MQMTKSHFSKSSSNTVPLPTPILAAKPTLVGSYYMTPFISVLISYTFISLDCLAEELEDPFGTENNDLPLDAICNAIEIDLLQMNDEAEIPAKILPDRHYQLT